MPSSADYCPACHQALFAPKAPRSPRASWPSIIRIIVLEIVLLLALAAAFVGYLNWSSEIAFAEFLSAGKTPAAPSSSLDAVKAPSCARGA